MREIQKWKIWEPKNESQRTAEYKIRERESQALKTTHKKIMFEKQRVCVIHMKMADVGQ